MDSSVYLLRKPINRVIKSKDNLRDCLIGPFRLKPPLAPIKDGQFHHCTFANISFKEAEIAECDFEDCVFIGCYFRKTRLLGNRFIACKFIDCTFPKVVMQRCTLEFTTFHRCIVEYSELLPNLPTEPELRWQLAANMAREAEFLSLAREARKFRLLALKAQEEHEKQSFLAKGSYYSTHFKGMDRVRAFLRYLSFRLRDFLWGHGEKGSRLLVNYLIVTLLVYPLLYSMMDSALHRVDSRSVSLLDIWIYSVGNTLAGAGFSSVLPQSHPVQIVAATEVLFGLIVIGLFVTLVFRAITRR